MNLQCNDIDSLLNDCISWARTHQRAYRQEALYGSSSDGGSIALRIHGAELEGHDYSMIVITNVAIPDGRQGQGLYRTFLSELDALDFGLRCHSMTENSWLADRHRAHGYKETVIGDTPTFYKIIGEPLPPLTDQTKPGP